MQPYAHVTPPPEWLELWLTHYRMVREYILKPIDDEKRGDEEIKLSGHLTVKEEQRRVIGLP